MTYISLCGKKYYNENAVQALAEILEQKDRFYDIILYH